MLTIDALRAYGADVDDVTANLSLTPVETPVREITELLRNRTETDYGPYLDRIAEARKKLTKLL